MSKWKDATTYRQGDTQRIPTAYQLDIVQNFWVTITKRHVICPGSWVMSCPRLSINMHGILPSSAPDEMAQKEVERLIKIALEEMLYQLEEVTNG